MPILLILLLLCLLLRAETTMAAASAACRLFVAAVLPGLFPYMVLSLMLVSRVKRLTPGTVMLLGWGGGSPTGARLLSLCPEMPLRQRVRLSVACATMSPMFLLGTVGGWLGDVRAGAVCLISCIAGGWLTGLLAGTISHTSNSEFRIPDSEFHPMSFGAAVEQSARTMLLVCGTIVMLRVFAALAAPVLPAGLVLPVTALLGVTAGTQALAGLSLPLAWRTAVIAWAAGFGGLAILLQNRAAAGESVLSLGAQLLWQALHGGISFLIALGLMTLLC